MTDWIVDIGDGSRQEVYAGEMIVEDAHLLGRDYRNGVTIASWAPGAWRRFWKKPDREALDELRTRLVTIKEYAASPYCKEGELGAAWMIANLEHRIEQMEALQPEEAA